MQGKAAGQSIPLRDATVCCSAVEVWKRRVAVVVVGQAVSLG